MGTETKTKLAEEIEAKIQSCRDQLESITARNRDQAEAEKKARQRVSNTDAEIKAAEAEIRRLDLLVTGQAARLARGETTMEEAKKKALGLESAKREKEVERDLLTRSRPLLVRKADSFSAKDPVAGRLPLADSNDRAAKVHQQLIFWELLQKYRETEGSANQVDHDLRNQAHRCRFSEEELDEAELIFREVLKGRGEFCDFSSRQIGGYIKPAPWPGC